MPDDNIVQSQQPTGPNVDSTLNLPDFGTSAPHRDSNNLESRFDELKCALVLIEAGEDFGASAVQVDILDAHSGDLGGRCA